MYELLYDKLTGKVYGVKNGVISFGLTEGNIDYQDFLKWNKVQKTPLDLKSTVPIVSPLPVGTVDQRIDKLEARVAILEKQ